MLNFTGIGILILYNKMQSLALTQQQQQKYKKKWI